MTLENLNRNVEIKARVPDISRFDHMIERAESLADDGPTVIFQEDTFFNCPRGRLKLRRFSHSNGELIFYDRPDSIEPEESRYIVCPTSTPDSLRDTLSLSLGTRGTVRKRRTLYLTGQTRIHFDEVEGLGNFVELEVVLLPEQDSTDGARVAEALMVSLGIERFSLVDRAYIDLLLEKADSQTRD